MTDDVFAWNFPGGRIHDIDEVVGAVATKSYVVPAGERWKVLGGMIERDVNADCSVMVYNEAGHKIFYLSYAAAGLTVVPVPNNTDLKSNYGRDLILDAGDYIKVTWGGGQTNPRVTIRVLKVEI